MIINDKDKIQDKNNNPILQSFDTKNEYKNHLKDLFDFFIIMVFYSNSSSKSSKKYFQIVGSQATFTCPILPIRQTAFSPAKTDCSLKCCQRNVETNVGETLVNSVLVAILTKNWQFCTNISGNAVVCCVGLFTYLYFSSAVFTDSFLIF